MIHGKEYKFIVDLIEFLNKNSIKKEDIISIGTNNRSIGVGTIPDYYYIIFKSEKENFDEVPLKLTD
jgi:hypothetical protein